jgi:hypothetical protein
MGITRPEGGKKREIPEKKRELQRARKIQGKESKKEN